LHFFFTLITCGLWQIVFAFLYNKQYMRRMLEKGYVLKDRPDVMANARMALDVADLD
jgi:hypothetical protein